MWECSKCGGKHEDCLIVCPWYLDEEKKGIKINIRQMVTGMKLPAKATSGAACYDAYIPQDYPSLSPGEIRIVDLGFQVEVPEGYELQVRSRSGLASRGILVANGVGCIDSDYRGNVGVILFNCSGSIQPLLKDDRICQLKLSVAPEIEWSEVDVVDCTERGEGGFGSTGGTSVNSHDFYAEAAGFTNEELEHIIDEEV